MILLSTPGYSQDLSWPDPVANDVIPMQSTPVTHGPVLGDVTASSIRVWLRAEAEIDFEVFFDDDEFTPTY
ncbi:MAG: hypothetical protein JJ992_04050, partial [Planctomycetes bacterium]|nr:hypothetical protein [Planctomycetota bacterium]